jgi:hypothetical protein
MKIHHELFTLAVLTTALGGCSGALHDDAATGTQSVTQDDWKHARLQSAEGVRISIDYQISVTHPSESETLVQATPAWINVTFPGACPSATRTVVSSFLGDPGELLSEVSSEQIDLILQRGDCRFSAELGKLTVAQGNESGGINLAQKVSIVADGNWLTDPVSNSHDFQVGLH